MNPIDFLQTIYTGDRLCKSIYMDGHKKEVKIGIDLISRVRGQAWNFYSDEDIQDGFIVLEGAVNIKFEPPGPIPNDWIDLDSVSFLEGDNLYEVIFSAGASKPDNPLVDEVKVIVLFESICLEDSEGKRIKN